MKKKHLEKLEKRLTSLHDDLTKTLAYLKESMGDGGEKSELNPQPLPPKKNKANLNPQPLPPKKNKANINPQPLPPQKKRK